jgi:hypothetical protein
MSEEQSGADDTCPTRTELPPGIDAPSPPTEHNPAGADVEHDLRRLADRVGGWERLRRIVDRLAGGAA